MYNRVPVLVPANLLPSCLVTPKSEIFNSKDATFSLFHEISRKSKMSQSREFVKNFCFWSNPVSKEYFQVLCLDDKNSKNVNKKDPLDDLIFKNYLISVESIAECQFH
jgi:hypothetical protein